MPDFTQQIVPVANATNFTDPSRLFGIRGTQPGIGLGAQDSFRSLFTPSIEQGLANAPVAPVGADEPSASGLDVLMQALERGGNVVAPQGRATAPAAPAAGGAQRSSVEMLAQVLGAAGGLRGRGGNAFTQRWRELQQRDLEARLREQQAREHAEDRQYAAEEREQRRLERERSKRMELYGLAKQAMEDVDTPEEYEQQMQHLQTLAPYFAYTPEEARALFPMPSVDKMTRQRMQGLYDRITKGKSAEELQAERQKNVVYDLDGKRYTLPQIEQQLGRAGLDPETGRPYVYAPAAKVNAADSPEERMLEALRRGDLEEARRIEESVRRIDAARRDPRPDAGQTAAQREAARLAEQRLDEQVAHLLTNPTAQRDGKTWADIRRQYQRMGVDFDARRNSIAVRIVGDRVQDANRRRELGSAAQEMPTAEDLIAESETLPDVDAGAGLAQRPGNLPNPSGRGRGVGAGPGGSRPYAGRRATRTDIEGVAQRLRISYDDARRQFVSGGGVVAD